MVLVIPREVAGQFEAGQQKLFNTHAKWKLLEQLIAKSKERSEFLSRIGVGFFALVQDSVITDIVISLGRLLDRPHANGNNNLTLERIR